jgi:hypothetical protein
MVASITVIQKRTRGGAMLGHHKLTHQGTAKVVSCEIRSGMRKKDSKGRPSSKFDVILDVFPEGAPPFRAEARQWFYEALAPHPEDSLRVRCNPEQKTVEIDLSEDRRFNPKLYRSANKGEEEKRHEELLNAPPGTPAPGYGDARSHGSSQPDPQVRRARVALREARRSGDTAEVERLAAELNRLEHGDAPGRPRPGPESIEQRLEKLQKLRDDGVLTPEEYTAQRHRILDSL